ncbi:hypothetical protein BS50DRAFT_579150 [Corynespora cassiicola Philippines]|uniref:Uncharacterized protein n=1 Tax=Corynespora cassiicola Philippines TaxID=1448308 RepID=A0A2T2N5G3_CORCC|nr:hypothetical protein BS50DRAFT_579150 [Corynespora cassiicola Philippines]
MAHGEVSRAGRPQARQPLITVPRPPPRLAWQLSWPSFLVGGVANLCTSFGILSVSPDDHFRKCGEDCRSRTGHRTAVRALNEMSVRQILGINQQWWDCYLPKKKKILSVCMYVAMYVRTSLSAVLAN